MAVQSVEGIRHVFTADLAVIEHADIRGPSASAWTPLDSARTLISVLAPTLTELKQAGRVKPFAELSTYV
jgi:hypothetical protein